MSCHQALSLILIVPKAVSIQSAKVFILILELDVSSLLISVGSIASLLSNIYAHDIPFHVMWTVVITLFLPARYRNCFCHDELLDFEFLDSLALEYFSHYAECFLDFQCAKLKIFLMDKLVKSGQIRSTVFRRSSFLCNIVKASLVSDVAFYQIVVCMHRFVIYFSRIRFN